MKTPQKIIQLLKTEGPLTANRLAEKLALTTMGVRQHMLQLEADGDVDFEDRKAARGRPTRYWTLTEQSDRYFPDSHETLTVQLIDSVKSIFGDQGLEKLIAHREQVTMQIYTAELAKYTDLKSKLTALAKLRSNEGYMASVVEQDNFYWLLENHCSICAAASQCLDFCRSELNQFQNLLKDVAKISREEHILEGARRCAYRVTPISSVSIC